MEKNNFSNKVNKFFEKFNNNDMLKQELINFYVNLTDELKNEFEEKLFSLKGYLVDIGNFLDGSDLLNEILHKKSESIGCGEVLMCFLKEEYVLSVKFDKNDILDTETGKTIQVKHYPLSSSSIRFGKDASAARFKFWREVLHILGNIEYINKIEFTIKNLNHFISRIDLIMGGEFNQTDIEFFKEFCDSLSNLDNSKISITTNSYGNVNNLLNHRYIKNSNSIEDDIKEINNNFNKNCGSTICFFSNKKTNKNTVVLNPMFKFTHISQNTCRFKIDKD